MYMCVNMLYSGQHVAGLSTKVSEYMFGRGLRGGGGLAIAAFRQRQALSFSARSIGPDVSLISAFPEEWLKFADEAPLLPRGG